MTRQNFIALKIFVKKIKNINEWNFSTKKKMDKEKQVEWNEKRVKNEDKDKIQWSRDWEIANI